jgi:hypothetical protein
MEKTLLIRVEGYDIWKQHGIPQEAIDFLDSISLGAEEAICKRFFMKFWKLKKLLSMNPYELP